MNVVQVGGRTTGSSASTRGVRQERVLKDLCFHHCCGKRGRFFLR